MTEEHFTYAEAGVDIEAGDRAVELMKDAVRGATRPEVVGGLGGFAGLFDFSAFAGFRRPLLATSTDGVGTKLRIAQLMNRHDTVGIDLVGMVVNDVVVVGAQPLFMTDYIACGKIVPERVAAIVSGVAQGCRLAGCALIGGETAEHPGVMEASDYDLAGAGVGVVEADQLLGPHRVRAGDALIAIASSGLHSNGYSLARHVLLTLAGLSVDAVLPELDGVSLGDVLLTPTRIYARDCLALAAAVDVHAFAHVTGGGLSGNLLRVLPPGLEAAIDRSSWTPPPIFSLIAGRGRVAPEEMERTFNLGVGMVAVVPGAEADAAVDCLVQRGSAAWVIGQVRPAS